ncbi:MAG: hypothetical protein CML20_21250 [Rheinheimera sp.]|uniref:DUF3014 domain-containing protein n=1 Tax=Arsukibacterium sp. UBA3155 TaxID=1946058 RepID=UPI000C8E1AB1|nr:DUF3014 domain-containing protein [Arsukibacterium sp. UBA3155]MAD77270.1 hypothetical protein [Rheinheimera sp.]|tara:strand:+ start:98422 stop:99285 length:864 start_codon:yes stop_codon:yes gene_type:complete
MTAQPSGSGQQLYYAGIAAVVIVILLALWMLFRPASETEPEVITPAPIPAEVVVEPILPMPVDEPLTEQITETETESEPEPVISAPEPEPLPTLEASDPVLKQDVLKLNWQPGLAGLINTRQMIRNLVVTVDNLAQKQLVAKHPVVVPLDQPFVTIADPESQTYQIDPASYQRYEPYIRLLESADPEQMLPIFKRYQPLFEQVFGELGYPELSFQQRMQQALTTFLAIAPMSVDTTLVRKSVAYTYADPAVESLSDLEKQVIRLGPDNHQRLRAVAKNYLTLLESRE